LFFFRKPIILHRTACQDLFLTQVRSPTWAFFEVLIYKDVEQKIPKKRHKQIVLSQLRVISTLFYLSHFTFPDLNSAKEPFLIFSPFSSSKSPTYEYYSLIYKRSWKYTNFAAFTEKKKDEDKKVDRARELFIVLSKCKEKRKKKTMKSMLKLLPHLRPDSQRVGLKISWWTRKTTDENTYFQSFLRNSMSGSPKGSKKKSKSSSESNHSYVFKNTNMFSSMTWKSWIFL